jgi:hypothetical protein
MASWAEAVTLSYRRSTSSSDDQRFTGDRGDGGDPADDRGSPQESALRSLAGEPRTFDLLGASSVLDALDRLDALQRAGRDRNRPMPDLTAGDHR